MFFSRKIKTVLILGAFVFHSTSVFSGNDSLVGLMIFGKVAAMAGVVAGIAITGVGGYSTLLSVQKTMQASSDKRKIAWAMPVVGSAIVAVLGVGVAYVSVNIFNRIQ